MSVEPRVTPHGFYGTPRIAGRILAPVEVLKDDIGRPTTCGLLVLPSVFLSTSEAFGVLFATIGPHVLTSAVSGVLSVGSPVEAVRSWGPTNFNVDGTSPMLQHVCGYSSFRKRLPKQIDYLHPCILAQHTRHRASYTPSEPTCTCSPVS